MVMTKAKRARDAGIVFHAVLVPEGETVTCDTIRALVKRGGHPVAWFARPEDAQVFAVGRDMVDRLRAISDFINETPRPTYWELSTRDAINEILSKVEGE